MTFDEVPPNTGWLGESYDVVRELGCGGMAVVYLARERATGIERAVKVIHHRLVGDPEAVARFAREARLVARLNHPRIVQIHAVESLDGMRIALVMDHIPGRTLKQLLRDGGPVSFDQAERILRDIADALGHAHERGIVHRDVKPENIFVDETTGHAMLSDFGIARSLHTDTQLTNAGVAIGTPTYMAPEQIDGDALDGRSDLYSLGMVGWEMVTGRRPWDGESLYSVLYHQKHDPLPTIDTIRPETPERLIAAIEGLLEKLPHDRWATAAEFRAQLEASTPVVRRVPRGLPPSAPENTVVVRRPVVAGATVSPNPPGPSLKQTLVGLLPEDEFEEPVTAAIPPRQSLFSRVGSGIRRPVLGVGLFAAATALFGAGALLITRLQLSPSLHDAFGLHTSVGMDQGVRVHVPARVLATTSAILASTRTSTGAPASPPAPANADDDVSDVLSTDQQDHTSGGHASSGRQGGEHASAGGMSPVASEIGSSGSKRSTARASTTLTGASPIIVVPPTVRTSPLTLPMQAPVLPMPPRLADPLRATDRDRAHHFSIVAGISHTCLIAPGGAASCWGNNDRGQLGGETTLRHGAIAAVGGNHHFSAIASGLSHTCALDTEGRVFCWGANDRGQLGDGTTSDRTTPTRIAGTRIFRMVVTGLKHSCALTPDGRAYCWGNGMNGQLGTRKPGDQTTSTLVATGATLTSIVAGWNHTCALNDAGEAYCWGENSTGALGDGTTTLRTTPVPVRTSARFVALTAGSAHTCGITASGEAYCWGQNSYGQLGDGTTGNRLVPTLVDAETHFAAISAGGVHNCALTPGHEAWCWGRNSYGQLGDGSTTDRRAPVRVSGGHQFVMLNAFGAHNCGVTTTNELFCWGYNLDGQLGDGTRENRLRPTYVEKPAGRE